MWKKIILLACLFNINYVELSEVESFSRGDIPDKNEDDIVCTPGAVGPEPHPSDCHRFIECSNDTVYVKKCGPGTAFSIPLKVCDYIYKVDCSGRGGKVEAPAITIADNKITCPSNGAGLYPHPHNCSKFVQCTNGRTFIQDCAPGTAFDSVRGLCDYKDKVKCCATCTEAEYKEMPKESVSENKITCPSNVTGLYPHPYKCNKFLQCEKGQTFIQDCAPGTAFDSVRRICDYKGKVKCCATCTGAENKHVSEESVSENKITCPSNVTGSYPHPYKCNKFLQCEKGQTFIQDCAPGTAFDSVRRICDYKGKVKCCATCTGAENKDVSEESVSPPSPGSLMYDTEHDKLLHTDDLFCLEGTTGFFPYPFDYNKFICCQNGTTLVKHCVPGSAFSISKGYCESLLQIHETDRVSYDLYEVKKLKSCPSGTDGLHLYPFNAELYVDCSNTQMKVLPCKNDYIFSVLKRSCLPRAQVKQNQRVRLLSELELMSSYHYKYEIYSRNSTVYCPDGGTRRYPYPFDSTKYLICSGGRLSLKSCAFDQVFSLYDNSCIRKHKLNAGNYVPQAKSTDGQEWTATDVKIKFNSIVASNYLSCPPGLDGYFLHPFNITKYIECRAGNAIAHTCLNSAFFDPYNKWCIPESVLKSNVDEKQTEVIKNYFSSFGQQPSPSSGSSLMYDTEHDMLLHTGDLFCLEGTTGFFPYPFDYKKFICCQNGTTLVKQCVPGSAFSISKGYCESLLQIHETDRVSYDLYEVKKLKSCPSGTDGLHLYPFNAELYVDCSNTQMKVLPCKDDYIFSVLKRSCLPRAQVRQNQRVRLLSELELMSSYHYKYEIYSRNSMVYCPDSGTRGYPYPFDSTKYLICSGGRLSLKSCAFDQVFSLYDNSCIWKHKLNAGNYVPQAKSTDGQEWTATDMKIKFNSMFASTYLSCPPGLDGYFLHPFNITKYIECREGAAIAHTCLDSVFFDPYNKRCIPESVLKSNVDEKQMEVNKNHFSSLGQNPNLAFLASVLKSNIDENNIEAMKNHFSSFGQDPNLAILASVLKSNLDEKHIEALKYLFSTLRQHPNLAIPASVLKSNLHENHIEAIKNLFSTLGQHPNLATPASFLKSNVYVKHIEVTEYHFSSKGLDEKYLEATKNHFKSKPLVQSPCTTHTSYVFLVETPHQHHRCSSKCARHNNRKH